MIKKGFSLFEIIFYILISCFVYKIGSTLYDKIKVRIDEEMTVVENTLKKNN